MTPPWGINWQSYHKDQQDMPHIAKMGYRSFTIYEWMWSNRDFCNELLSVARKDAIFLDRDHPMSEQKDGQWKSDPAAKGRNHADDWAQKVKDGKVFTPLDRTYFLGLNEPNSNEFQRQIDAYNEAYCRRMAEHGLRAAAYSFGVGHPSTIDLDPKKPPDWHWYEASAAAILEGHHLAAFHEYGAPSVGGYGWEFWCNRCSFCPYPFDAGLDECGIDNGVVAGILKGYAEFMSGEQYCKWLDGFQAGMAERAHTRKVNLLFYNIFSFDHGRGDEKDWHSWDIRPMRPLLEAFQWTVVASQPLPPQPPKLPGGPTPQGDNWERSITFVLKQEGKFSVDVADPGNYVNGVFVGTKYGISAAAHPGLDIVNLTIEQAQDIYFKDYWQKSGADQMPWPLCLAVFDLAVNGGVGRAQQALTEAGADFTKFMAWRIAWYTRLAQFNLYGPAWIRRCSVLMMEAAK